MNTKLKAPQGFSGINRHTKVALVGAGGTGSAMAARLLKLHQSLVAVGDYGLEVTVYDPKTVTETNVIRQHFWSESDIGFPKASLLVNRYNQFGGMNWQYVVGKFNVNTLKGLPDLIITTVDSAKARLEIGKHLSTLSSYHVNDKLWLDLGNGSNGGNAYIGSQYAHSGSGDAPSPYQLFKQDWEEIDDSKISEPSCSAREALLKQNLGVNDALASMALFRILAPLMLKGEIEISGFFLDSISGEMTIPFGENSWAIYGYVDSKVDTAA
ncbi:PRTRC system ThiF family protein [Vibrio sp. 10N.239.312.D08]|uniref:PRTRC system ThiF family protein n=1 Tax=Vibrio sp. 10N.239.312.D08 TaxID=3229978 RepID=UPI00355259CF